MEIKALIDDANAALYAKVSVQYQVKLVPQADWRACAWQSTINTDTLEISYCPTEFPKAAFSRELLSVDAHMSGFKSVYAGIALDRSVRPFLPTLLKYLNKSFVEHKIAARFLSLGYPREQFHAAPEGDAADFWLSELQTAGHSLLYVSLLYLDFIAPLVPIALQQQQALQKAFAAYDNGNFLKSLGQTKGILGDWTLDPS